MSLNLLIFVSYLSTCVWSRYQSIVFLSYGVSASRIGLLKSIGYLVKLFSAPAWAALSDVKFDPVNCLIFCYAVGILTIYTLWRLLLDDNKAPFAILILLRIVRSSVGAVSNLTDSLIFETTKNDKVKGYGRSRMWGSLAWGAGSIVGGYLIDKAGLGVVFPFTIFWNGCTILALVCFKNCGRASKRGTEMDNNKLENSKYKQQGVRHIVNEIKKLLLVNDEIRAFSICIVLNGFVMTLADSLLPLQIEALKGSRQFSGMTTLVSILGGLPVFYHSKAIYLRFGPWWMIRVGSLILSFRLLIFATIFNLADLNYILVVQLLHGITFALVYTSSTEYLQRAVKNGNLSSSISTLINTLYFTVGQGVGNVFWGHLYEFFGRANEAYVFGALIIAVNVWLFRGSQKDVMKRKVPEEVGIDVV
ncbi:hypothetical protein TrST_g13159 [Triparma strigata]|uniref:Major facilitator superfamily associated domain-containing protein n=1 Tax=Triparma strigata TaxID=1606541 RepID=A0A9W7B9H4_9STRA|nr:hypothetical protein TrST_g13159 [Triparma strigata]